jgi:D-alanyl-D-alanine carboxypeptidase
MIMLTLFSAIISSCGIDDANMYSTILSEGSPNDNSVYTSNHLDIPEKEFGLQVVAEPDSITVLVNKHFVLPKDYKPKDLVYPEIPFIFNEITEKRMMRQEAAQGLEQLVAGAKKDGIFLAGVSAYRSYATQKAIFNYFVKTDGESKARTYSAMPGASEHETGLAIDISGRDGKCAAVDCFAGSNEAIWLDRHAAEYGFIIRYPNKKESITGYQYEPWHIRYVGVKVSKEMASKGINLEEYFNALSLSK